MASGSDRNGKPVAVPKQTPFNHTRKHTERLVRTCAGRPNHVQLAELMRAAMPPTSAPTHWIQEDGP
jgi:hypothetical protein